MKIVSLGPLGVSEEKIRGIAAEALDTDFELEIFSDVKPVPEEMISCAADAEAMIISNLPFSKEVAQNCPKLKFLTLSYTGTDRIDLVACKEAGITVCNAPDYSTQAVAEFTLGLILSVLRRITQADGTARSGGTWHGLVGEELAGRTVGIIGTGNIGLQVAKLLTGFDCSLLGFNRRQREEALELGMVYVDLETLLSRSDIVSLHLPLTEETKNIVDGHRLSLMKSSAVLVNTARGEIVDNSVLAEMIAKGELAGAGIDTMDIRPPIPTNHLLLQQPNVVVTPHMAFATRQAFARRTRIVFENLKSWRLGQPRNVVLEI